MKRFILLLTLVLGSVGLHGQFINDMISRQGRMLISYVQEGEYKTLENGAVTFYDDLRTGEIHLEMEGEDFHFSDKPMGSELPDQFPRNVVMDLVMDREIDMPSELKEKYHFFEFHGDLRLDGIAYSLRGQIEMQEMKVDDRFWRHHYTLVLEPEDIPDFPWPKGLSERVEIDWFKLILPRH